MVTLSKDGAFICGKGVIGSGKGKVVARSFQGNIGFIIYIVSGQKVGGCSRHPLLCLLAIDTAV